MRKNESLQVRADRGRLVRNLSVFLIVFGFLLAACSETGSPACPEGAHHFVKYELYMGRSMADGDTVSDEEWDRFLADSVTPRFPDGLTVLDAEGQWRNSEGRILKERSVVLVILAPPGEEGRRLIDEVSDQYQRRFDQESVLAVESDSCVSFS